VLTGVIFRAMQGEIAREKVTTGDDMPNSRRSMLIASAAGLASAGALHRTGHANGGIDADAEVAGLIQRSFESNAHLMRGDIKAYRTQITLSDDFTLMSPFGGAPTRASDMTDERWEAMGRFFRSGTLEQEVVQSYASADMVVLATVERAEVGVGGLPRQEWLLRVTLVYCRSGGEWKLAHRHADPLVAGITLEQAAALARSGRR